MAVFEFPYHTVSTEHPVSGVQMQLGNSYEYASEPTAPDQRIFHLQFAVMKYYKNPEGEVDATINPELNIKALSDFYEVHKLWKTFDYPHPVYGTVKVRFSKPLVIPKGAPGGGGAHFDIALTFKEQP